MAPSTLHPGPVEPPLADPFTQPTRPPPPPITAPIQGLPAPGQPRYLPKPFEYPDGWPMMRTPVHSPRDMDLAVAVAVDGKPAAHSSWAAGQAARDPGPRLAPLRSVLDSARSERGFDLRWTMMLMRGSGPQRRAMGVPPPAAEPMEGVVVEEKVEEEEGARPPDAEDEGMPEAMDVDHPPDDEEASRPRPLSQPLPQPQLQPQGPPPPPSPPAAAQPAQRTTKSSTQNEAALALRIAGAEGKVNPNGQCDGCRKANVECRVLRDRRTGAFLRCGRCTDKHWSIPKCNVGSPAERAEALARSGRRRNARGGQNSAEEEKEAESSQAAQARAQAQVVAGPSSQAGEEQDPDDAVQDASPEPRSSRTSGWTAINRPTPRPPLQPPQPQPRPQDTQQDAGPSAEGSSGGGRRRGPGRSVQPAPQSTGNARTRLSVWECRARIISVGHE